MASEERVGAALKGENLLAQNKALTEQIEAERRRYLKLAREHEALREGSALWQVAMEGTGVGVLELDVATGDVELSAGWCVLSGYSAGELTSLRDLQAVIHPHDGLLVSTDIERVVANGDRTDNVVYRLRHKDGNWIFVQSRLLVSRRDKDGRPARLVCTHIDVTEVQRAQDALRESETRFRILADGAPVVLFVNDPAAGVQFVNQTYCDYFGVTAEEVEGGKWRPLIHPDDAGGYIRRYLAAVAAHVPFEGEARV